VSVQEIQTVLYIACVIADRVSRERKAIGRVRPSVRLSVRPSVCLFVFTLSFDQLDHCTWVFVYVGYDHSSPEIESQGHRSRWGQRWMSGQHLWAW